jgi:hypothetical protein
MAKTSLVMALLMVGAFLAGVSGAAVVKEVHFAPGSNAALVEGAVIRGERDRYTLTARAGQKMAVSITAVEKNAAVAIYQPGYTVGQDADGILEVKGTALPGASEMDDATAWKMELPGTGRYLIVVSPTRGNATYKLKVSIH